MKTLTALTALVLLMSHATADDLVLLESLRPYVEQVAGSIDEVPSDRRKVLDEAAEFVSERLTNGDKAALTFICTHNSRRSHLSHVWAQVAAEYYGLIGVKTYSGGTEATACNLRTVRALERAGLRIKAITDGDNPIYAITYAKDHPPIEAFSKVYNVEGNPQEGFAAMMCCSDVDEKCPIVYGAAARIALHYEDPKASDGTPEESATYDERCAQIAREMFYLFAVVAKK